MKVPEDIHTILCMWITSGDLRLPSRSEDVATLTLLRPSVGENTGSGDQMDQGYKLMVPFPLSKGKKMEKMSTYSVTGTDFQAGAGALLPQDCGRLTATRARPHHFLT